jgi:hypothetical protein
VLRVLKFSKLLQWIAPRASMSRLSVADGRQMTSTLKP